MSKNLETSGIMHFLRILRILNLLRNALCALELSASVNDLDLDLQFYH